MDRRNSAIIQLRANTTENQRLNTMNLHGEISCLGGDQHLLMLSLLSSDTEEKKLLIDDWSKDLGEP